MLYRTVPKNGDSLSILGFGCMRLPMQNGKIDEPRAISQIRYAIDSGVNYLDTAWPYHGGESERLLGEALKDGYRERIKLATKLPSFLIKSRHDMDRYLDAQLEKLGTDHIDYYLVHTLNGPLWDNLVKLGIHDFLDQAQGDGRIINAGFSFHGLADDFCRIVDDYAWVFCQIQYNFLDQEYQAGRQGLEYAAGKNLAVIIMEPLRGGNLGLSEPPPAIKVLWQQSDKTRSPVEWALLWLWHHPGITVVLSGMNEEAHINENLKIADSGFPHFLKKEELALVDEVARTYRKLMKVGCTGCGYCLPCSSGVLIPGCFELYNTYHMFEQPDSAKFSYAIRMSGDLADGTPRYASLCVQCGECLEKCPQDIPIPDVLEQVVSDLEGPDLDQRLSLVRKTLLKELP